MLASSNVNAKIPNMWLSAFPSDEGSPKAGVGLLTHPVMLRMPPLCHEGNTHSTEYNISTALFFIPLVQRGARFSASLEIQGGVRHPGLHFACHPCKEMKCEFTIRISSIVENIIHSKPYY